MVIGEGVLKKVFLAISTKLTDEIQDFDI